jgi:hypothetical protein
MSPLALLFLRRVSLLALLGAAALVVWTRGSAALGVDAPDKVARAEAALAVARDYGADDGVPSYVHGQKELAAARALLERGDRREARITALRAEARALEAQRGVIVEKESLRTRSEEIVAEIDRHLNEIETLYGDTVKTVDRARASGMLSRMKLTRSAGASLILAHEQGDHRKVVRERDGTIRLLEETRRQFEAAGRS